MCTLFLHSPDSTLRTGDRTLGGELRHPLCSLEITPPPSRRLIIGLTNYTNKAHLCRATLEAVCFQSREILEAMNQDSHLPLSSLRVDGGMTGNRLLLHLQADILGLCVGQWLSGYLVACAQVESYICP